MVSPLTVIVCVRHFVDSTRDEALRRSASFYLIPKTSPVFTARLSSPFIHGPLEKGAAKKWSIPASDPRLDVQLGGVDPGPENFCVVVTTRRIKFGCRR